ncbi:Hypothetical predicted protein, partial [Olea europaea subsp. europaea]
KIKHLLKFSHKIVPLGSKNSNTSKILYLGIKMRVREMHPLCCITLESQGIGNGSPEPMLLRTGSAVAFSGGGSTVNAGGSEVNSSSTTTSVAGILYKWTNYGKGWRSRWFTLRSNGVLSYSKTRRPDIISGDDVILIGNVKPPSSRKRSKAVGIVHLKYNKEFPSTEQFIPLINQALIYSGSHQQVNSRGPNLGHKPRFTRHWDKGKRELETRIILCNDPTSMFESWGCATNPGCYLYLEFLTKMGSWQNDKAKVFYLKNNIYEINIRCGSNGTANYNGSFFFPDIKKLFMILKEDNASLLSFSLLLNSCDKTFTLKSSVHFSLSAAVRTNVTQIKFSLFTNVSCYDSAGSSLQRILYVAAFAVSGYASSEGRHCKPFNPLLGETYEADYPDKRVRFFSEKVSHHPTLIACHCEGEGWKFWGDSNLRSKFWGRSIQVDPVGTLTLEFEDGEIFQWNKVTTSIYNLILGNIYCDHHGTMHIQGNRQYSCKLKFKEQSILDRNPHQVHGFVEDVTGKKFATLFGKWDESMYFVNGDGSGKVKDKSDASLLWKKNELPLNLTRYNLTSFAITLNELTPGLKEKLPPTDSRLRPDQRHLENGEYDKANSEKLRLEMRQRMSTKLQENGWKPRWFDRESEEGSFRYVGGYWEARDQGKWDGCPNIFGEISEDLVSSFEGS